MSTPIQASNTSNYNTGAKGGGNSSDVGITHNYGGSAPFFASSNAVPTWVYVVAVALVAVFGFAILRKKG